jgi:preprotein translocase subunit YajC
MEVNYVVIGLILLAAIVFIVWFIKRNRKDKKEFEEEINRKELPPEQHDEDQV